ncbi:MAG TPA: hypothetical protein DCS07_00370 [Bdellovibrionales bacterium]|nr:MAG: hypothetical protein A2X97_06300 [Bdellovibrionales bacterium GWA1_52_35]OFZ42924.1 MAG: hypothetical protein A2070_04655 [Bdellovibrionales bacterium GWC1_52_8]HAR41084.1 hypothetical protein [Bdellovibrionales bacterium]HCM40899.1 hypothetical protein [Bdellovibrionales bacterium]
MSLLGLLSLILLGMNSHAADLQHCQEGDSSMSSLIQATQSALAVTGSSCGRELTKADRAEIKKMHQELLGASKKNKAEPQRSRAISKIVARHEKKLSSTAVAVILAEAAQIRVGIINEGLKANPALARSIQQFNNTAADYTKNRNKMFGGSVGLRDDDRKLDQATLDLKKAVDSCGLDPDSKKILVKNMYAVLSQVYQNASKRAEEGAKRASVGLFYASSILSADLVALSYLGLFTPVGAVAGVAARVAVASASSAAGGMGLGGLDALGRMAGYAAVRKDGRDFHCKLADEINLHGREALNQALTGAIIGGGLGGGLAGTAAVNLTAAKTLATGASGLFAYKSGKDSLESHKEARALRKEAKIARLKGDFAGALALENRAKNAQVNTAASSLGTLLALSGTAGSGKLSRGLRTSIVNRPKVIARPLPLAKRTNTAQVCPLKPAPKYSLKPQKNKLPSLGLDTGLGKLSSYASVGLISFGALSTLSGCGNTKGGSSDEPADPTSSSCTETNSCVVKLAWDAPVDPSGAPVSLSGYKIYWGTTPGMYSNWIDVGNKTEAEVTGLGAGTYYFSATAYRPGEESGFSNVVSTDTKTSGKEVFPETSVTIANDGTKQMGAVR